MKPERYVCVILVSRQAGESGVHASTIPSTMIRSAKKIFHLPDAALTLSKRLAHWEGPLIDSKSNLLSPYRSSKR